MALFFTPMRKPLDICRKRVYARVQGSETQADREMSMDIEQQQQDDRRDYAAMLDLAHQVALTPTERQWYRATRGMFTHEAWDLI